MTCLFFSNCTTTYTYGFIYSWTAKRRPVSTIIFYSKLDGSHFLEYIFSKYSSSRFRSLHRHHGSRTVIIYGLPLHLGYHGSPWYSFALVASGTYGRQILPKGKTKFMHTTLEVEEERTWSTKPNCSSVVSSFMQNILVSVDWKYQHKVSTNKQT